MNSTLRVMNSIISIIIFVLNPSLEDDSDETRNLKISNSLAMSQDFNSVHNNIRTESFPRG